MSDAAHVHLAVAAPQGRDHATYVTLQDRYFCGHRVIKVDNNNQNIILEGLTHQTMQRFSVPQCWEPATSMPLVPSNISASMTSGGAGIGVSWKDNSNNEEGFDIGYSPTQDILGAKHDLAFPNQTFLSSGWGLNRGQNGLLLPGQTMCFQVSAYNAAGSSDPTSWSCITVP
jgi:hypothetical protein